MENKNIRDRNGLNFSKSAISYILKNTIYTGKIKYASKVYQGIHQPIISEEIFNLAQETHKKKRRIMRLYKDYLLVGLVRCKECGSFMTPSYTNKKKQGKIKRYYYYRCTITTKRDWNACSTKQVNTDRLERFVFENLERISLDRHYIDSLFFMLKNGSADDRIGLEPSSDSSKISSEIFQQTLQLFLKTISQKKGIEKNLLVKKFIRDIIYSKEQIQINLYLSIDSKNLNLVCLENEGGRASNNLEEKFLSKNPQNLVRNDKIGSVSATKLEIISKEQ